MPTAGNGRNRRLPCHVVFQQVLATATNDTGLTQAEVSEDDQYDDNDTNDVKDVHACLPLPQLNVGWCKAAASRCGERLQ